MSDLQARRWVARGRVQGVGFRWFIQTKAQGLGVRGWVRNLPDGAVEVVGMATAATLDALQIHIQRGPRGSDVTEVAVSDIPHKTVDAKLFTIKH